MVINDLRINITDKPTSAEIVSRQEFLSRAIEGNWATLFKGQGLEFTGFRQYNYSDDASMIDWRASLRSGSILVREFEDYKNFNIVFFLDVSDSMLFTSGDKLKAEFGAELAYSLAEAAFQAGDAVGLVMFTDHVVSSIEPGIGSGMRDRIKKSLLDGNNYGGKRDLKKSLLELSSFLNSTSSIPALVLIISDFIGLPEGWEKYLNYVANRHQPIGLMVCDPRDRKLPKHDGQFTIQDPNSDETMLIDTSQFANEYEKYNIKREESVKRIFKKLRSDCLIIENETNFVKVLESFFEQQRKLIK